MDAKEKVGVWAASEVADGMTVGLGTGSTSTYFIRALARRIQDEGIQIRMAASSFSTALLAAELGLTLMPLEQVSALDLYVDGADEVDPLKRLLKGRGAAMVREKMLAHVAKRFLVLIDASKRVDKLGARFPIPVEIFPFAYAWVRRELEELGATVKLRLAGASKDGPVVTDQGNFILDARFDPAVDVASLEPALDGLSGAVGHGLFTRFGDRITVAMGTATGVERLP